MTNNAVNRPEHMRTSSRIGACLQRIYTTIIRRNGNVVIYQSHNKKANILVQQYLSKSSYNCNTGTSKQI